MPENNSLGMIIENYNKQNKDNDIIEIKYSEPLSRHAAFRIGGVADFYLTPHSAGALKYLINCLKTTEMKYFILGNGSNVLFDDSGYRGAVISLACLTKIKADGDVISAESGAFLNSVCKTARDNGLTGLEFAYGIPGSVGGAVYMNAGAYGGEISSVLCESTYLDANSGEIRTITNAEHAYGYRESVYKHHDYVILSAKFKLQIGDKAEISSKMNDYMSRRIEKQPLDYPSAGSVFKRYPGRFTGQMIEECGLKGYAIGGAQVSEKHAGFIINKGGATCSDVLALIEYIKEKVYEKFGCAIECEVIYVK